MRRIRFVEELLGPGILLLLLFPSGPGFADSDLKPASGEGSGGRELSGSRPHTHVERLKAATRAQAHLVDFFAPFYSIEGARDAKLFLLNTIAEPIFVDVVARAEDRELPLGSYTIAPQRHLEISLRERLAGFERDFGTGTLRLSVLGDEDTLQAWVVVEEPDGQTFELPLIAPGESTALEFYGFWDATPLGKSGPSAVIFHFLNTSDRELSLYLATDGAGRGDSGTFLVQPGEALLVSGVGKAAFGQRGWLKVRHDGDPGDLVGVGIIGDRTRIGAVHLVPREEAEASKLYESLPMPARQSAPTPGTEALRGGLALLNVGSDRQEVLLEALDAASGARLAQSSVRLPPWELTTVPLARLLPRGIDSRQARLRVQGSAHGLLARGTEIAGPSLAADLPFFSAYHAHGNGTYPLPDLEQYETVTPILNLGDEPAEIVAQLYWEGGTFALGPIIIPAGGSHLFDFEELVRTAAPDLLQRSLDPNGPPAVFKWTVMSGSSKLLGRTLVRPRRSEDWFGFNCFGCCVQTPKGRVVPSGVEFLPGQLRDFEIAVVYTTCSGEMGPYPTGASSLTVPSPFTWDGLIVGATGSALEILSFTGSATKITSGCQEFTVNFNGFGTGDTCKGTLGPWNPAKTCTSQTTSCSLCHACCEQIRAYNLCRRVHPDVAQQEYQTCITHCITDICG